MIDKLIKQHKQASLSNIHRDIIKTLSIYFTDINFSCFGRKLKTSGNNCCFAFKVTMSHKTTN